MTLFTVERTSGCGSFDADGNNYGEGPPCEGAFLREFEDWDLRTFKTPEEYDAIFGREAPWLSVGDKHCFAHGGIARRFGKRKAWCVEVDDLIEFVKKHGPIVLSECSSLNDSMDPACPPHIEIYDGYRE